MGIIVLPGFTPPRRWCNIFYRKNNRRYQTGKALPASESWAFYVRICVRKSFQNLLKLDNIEENLLNGKIVISISYNNLRRLESSGVLPENPRVRSSILRLGTINISIFYMG
jgi:hypothetical protein